MARSGKQGGWEAYDQPVTAAATEPRATITDQGKLILNVIATRKFDLFPAEARSQWRFVKLLYNGQGNNKKIAIQYVSRNTYQEPVLAVTRINTGILSSTAVISIRSFLNRFGIDYSKTTTYKIEFKRFLPDLPEGKYLVIDLNSPFASGS